MLLRICLFTGMVCLLLGCQREEPLEVQYAKLYFMIGDVTVNGQPGKIDQILNKNDLIVTGSQSRAEIILGTHSGVQLREKSEAQVSLEGNSWQLNVQKGAVLNLMARGRNYRITSPTAVVAIRGTIFYSNVYNEQEQYICACNGTLDIEYGTDTLTVSASHHTGYLVSGKDAGKSIGTEGMKEHNDVEIFEFMYRMNEALRSQD